MKGRRTQIAVGGALVVLLLVRQAVVAGLVPTLLVATIGLIMFAALVLAIRVRAGRPTGDSCPALLPTWAAMTAASRIKTSNPNVTLPGTLRFSPGTVEWVPTNGGVRMGAQPVRWAIETPDQLRLFVAGRLASQMLVTIVGGHGEVVADVWARSTEERAIQLAALTTAHLRHRAVRED
ncbi:hypothetical protein CELL_02134 [Cellulomonas sp. T2.31MG-18]